MPWMMAMLVATTAKIMEISKLLILIWSHYCCYRYAWVRMIVAVDIIIAAMYGRKRIRERLMLVVRLMMIMMILMRSCYIVG